MVYNKTKDLGLGRKIELIFRIQMHVSAGTVLFRQALKKIALFMM